MVIPVPVPYRYCRMCWLTSWASPCRRDVVAGWCCYCQRVHCSYPHLTQALPYHSSPKHNKVFQSGMDYPSLKIGTCCHNFGLGCYRYVIDSHCPWTHRYKKTVDIMSQGLDVWLSRYPDQIRYVCDRTRESDFVPKYHGYGWNTDLLCTVPERIYVLDRDWIPQQFCSRTLYIQFLLYFLTVVQCIIIRYRYLNLYSPEPPLDVLPEVVACFSQEWLQVSVRVLLLEVIQFL
jgi:hypothetical protein